MKLRTFRPLFFRRLAGMCRRQQSHHLMLPIRNKWLIEVAQREFSLTKADAILTVAVTENYYTCVEGWGNASYRTVVSLLLAGHRYFRLNEGRRAYV